MRIVYLYKYSHNNNFFVSSIVVNTGKSHIGLTFYTVSTENLHVFNTLKTKLNETLHFALKCTLKVKFHGH